MEQNIQSGGAMSPATVPVVRQLDFTFNFKAPRTSNASAKGNLILPEHPQAQLESKLLALAQSQKLHATANCQSPPRVAAQTKLPPRKMVMPPRSPQRELPGMVAPRLTHSMKPVPVPKPASNPLPKSDASKSRERSSYDPNDGTPKKQKQCNCKNSRCLKLYCECFASGVYCDGCNCLNCHNKMAYEGDRKEAVESILERNPNAFRPKIAGSPHGAKDGAGLQAEHNKGCNCKKSGCLKKYCECFQANILCSNKCKCLECKNFEGSEERRALLHQHSPHSMEIIQQATNAAIHGAIGTPKRKVRNKQLDLGTSRIPQLHQGICLTPASYSPRSVPVSKPSERPKSPYRSPLTGILQLQEVEDFCIQLVELSTKATAILSECKMVDEVDAEGPQLSVSSSLEDSQSQQTTVASCGTSLSESDGNNIPSGRPFSPGILALMCDEQGMKFLEEANTQSTTSESNTTTDINSASEQHIKRLYIEQEKLVLTKLHDLLNKLITRASIKVDDAINTMHAVLED